MELTKEQSIAKAKLYNLKSGLEGLIQTMETGVISADQAMEGCTKLAAKAFDDYMNQSRSQ